MKLHDFLTRQGSSCPSPTRPVTFKILGVDGRTQALVADATAELAFVPEAVRQEALRDADKAIVEQYGDGGRSLRSSRSAGKPRTRRRGTVDA